MADVKLAIFTTILVWIKRLLTLALFVVLLVFFVNFTLSNTEQVVLELGGMSLPSFSTSTLVLVPFVIGGLVGLVISLILVTRLRLANASLKRKLERRDTELHKLRSSALKGITDA
ncbi:lipopolysaccharide assembly protein LapA domain-containing protein [Endozoicomonas ascidiicola]|uniref:lipopolysaccharide assembly protein LapA domain-containing protein n=1 Tax=Endozoicomonas ascidiicola TaxID=1698521 RepID=UPI00082A1D1D|nr:LapA family protein [Endozoicomonas ascidiicola]